MTHDDSYTVIGIDPGATTGFAALYIIGGTLVGHEFGEGAHDAAPGLLRELLSREPDTRHFVAIERYTVRRRAGRVKGRPGEVTRRVTFELILLAQDRGGVVVERSASRIKSWATNQRLATAGLIEPSVGLGHARDAGRHALYEAVHRSLITDPAEALL